MHHLRHPRIRRHVHPNPSSLLKTVGKSLAVILLFCLIVTMGVRLAITVTELSAFRDQVGHDRD